MVRGYITLQELEENYEYKIIKRILKKEFPWIKNVFMKKENLEKYTVLFVTIEVDQDIFMEIYKVHLRAFPKREVEEGNTYESPFLSLIFEFADKSVGTGIEEDVVRTMNSVKKSKAIPPELKLPNERTWSVDVYFIK